jgi:hypothetical protein
MSNTEVPIFSNKQASDVPDMPDVGLSNIRVGVQRLVCVMAGARWQGLKSVEGFGCRVQGSGLRDSCWLRCRVQDSGLRVSVGFRVKDSGLRV